MKRPTVTLYCKTSLSVIVCETSNIFTHCVREHLSHVLMNLNSYSASPSPAPERVSGKPHAKRTSEHLYIRILSGGSFDGQKSVNLRSHGQNARYASNDNSCRLSCPSANDNRSITQPITSGRYAQAFRKNGDTRVAARYTASCRPKRLVL